MRTPLTDDEAIAAIRQLADRPWDQGSVKQCVVKGTLHALLGVLAWPGDALAASLNVVLSAWLDALGVKSLSGDSVAHADGLIAETGKGAESE